MQFHLGDLGWNVTYSILQYFPPAYTTGMMKVNEPVQEAHWTPDRK